MPSGGQQRGAGNVKINLSHDHWGSTCAIICNLSASLSLSLAGGKGAAPPKCSQLMSRKTRNWGSPSHTLDSNPIGRKGSPAIGAVLRVTHRPCLAPWAFLKLQSCSRHVYNQKGLPALKPTFLSSYLSVPCLLFPRG